MFKKGRDFMKYYERLRKTRIKHGFTQTQIAERLNIKQSTYAKYECGTRTIPVDKLREFCLITNTSSNYILGLSNNYKYPG